MRPKRILLLIVALSLLGCASNSRNAAAPPANTAPKFSGWSNIQLETRAAQDRRDLARADSYGLGATDTSMFGQMAREDKQQELEDVESEMMRRDPSGQLLNQSHSMY
jgi:hypothetical protein